MIRRLASAVLAVIALAGTAGTAHAGDSDAVADTEVLEAEREAQAGRLGAAAVRLKREIGRIDRETKIEDQVIAHAILARRYRQLKNTVATRREHAKVIATWSKFTLPPGTFDDRARTRRVGSALEAVGEVLFFDAEEKRAKALALTPPPFRGVTSDDAIKLHLRTAVADWLRKRRTLDKEAEAAYRRVVELKPMPPSWWVVASAARVATMLEALPAALERVPIPPSISKNPELVAVYKAALHDATEPSRNEARAALRMCKQYAAKLGVAGEYAELCEKRLTALGEP